MLLLARVSVMHLSMLCPRWGAEGGGGRPRDEAGTLNFRANISVGAGNKCWPQERGKFEQV